MDLPLGDIRVIDLTIARAGPTCVRQPSASSRTGGGRDPHPVDHRPPGPWPGRQPSPDERPDGLLRHRLAEAISRNAPLTIAAAKAAIREAAQPAGQRDLARVEAMVEACFRSEDYREGQRAFTEKRPPTFTGR